MVAKALNAICFLSGVTRRVMKKIPLFEHEISTYRKRPTEWIESKPTR